jgi:hypothetical protein
MKTSIIISVIVIFSGLLCTQNTQINPEVDVIKKVIFDAYVEGIFNKGDASLAREGFHPECDALILRQDQLMKISAYTYVERFEKNPGPLQAGTTHQFTDVNVTGYAAMAIVEIYQNGEHIYTDYFSLYKFHSGWKVVTKIYYAHDQNEGS